MNIQIIDINKLIPATYNPRKNLKPSMLAVGAVLETEKKKQQRNQGVKLPQLRLTTRVLKKNYYAVHG